MPNNVTKRIKSAPKQKGWLLLAIFSFTIIVAIVFFGVLFYRDVSKNNFVGAKLGNKALKLELADTDAKRVKGLSERDSLAPNQGMLFDFGQDGDWRMWMVQMRFPIDIIWLDNQKKIIHIKENARPADFPEKYRAPEWSRYVIEVNSGVATESGVKSGDKVSF